VFGRVQAFGCRVSRNVQVTVKDSKKYGATGGWGFGDFTDGEAAAEAKHKTCFLCHEPARLWTSSMPVMHRSMKARSKPCINQVHTMVEEREYGKPDL